MLELQELARVSLHQRFIQVDRILKTGMLDMKVSLV